MCSILSCAFITLAVLTSQVLCNDGPIFTHLEPNVVVYENIPVGSVLTNITAMDSDGPKELHFSIPAGHPSAQFVEFKNERGSSINGRTVDLVLKQELNRDYMEKNFIQIIFTVDDNPGTNTGNQIPREIILYVKDVNDEPPAFEKNRYEPEVSENTPVGTSILTVVANDPDQGRGNIVTYSMELVGQAVSEEYRTAFKIDPTNGTVTVNGPLDANLHYIYEYKLIGKDYDDLEGNSILLIKIKDIQDKPPYFTNLPYSATIKENAPLNSQVLQVTAQDGDRRSQNNVTYSIISDGSSNFNLNATTGWITLKTQLDRDDPDVRQRGGAYAITVMAKETDSSQPIERITATTQVTITVSDVNDNAPVFNSPTYEASILENMQEGVPITFTGPGSTSVMNAKDVDQGTNSHFELFLEKDGQPYDDFAPLPNEIFFESSILIRVKNKTALDYEKLTSVTFQIVAREKDTAERRSSSATVTVNIIDMNDNTPYMPANYPVYTIAEDARKGTEVVKLNATDLDTGNYGNISYSIRGGNGVFMIDPITGMITLAGELDREKVDFYFLTAEARDGGGLTTIANLQIKVTDVNDKYPVFRREEYYATVREDSVTFLRGDLVVEATDDDEPDTPNSQVMYRIVQASAGLENKFFVNQSTGIILLRDTIDYESLPAELNGRIQVEIEAYDQGNKQLTRSINITIELEDVNDNSPKFNQTKYIASIPENTVAGSSVVTVFATDADSTTPNNAFLYRVDSGAGDKFRINFQTGEITVEVGAKLDRETKDFYTLNVSATDRGAKSLSGSCVVEIHVTDVNDEPPVFMPPVITASVNENRKTGYEVTCATATDRDTNPALVYSLITDSGEGLDENRKDVNIEIQKYFSIGQTTGCIQIFTKLDREMAEVLIFEVLATDMNAVVPQSGTNTQTATATVTITVTDYNDNQPIFVPSNTFQLSISEGLAKLSEVMRFETNDADKDQTVSYSLVSDQTNNFMIDSGSGILRLREVLDRESNSMLELVVVAEDNGVPTMSSSATVSITVEDVNDNNPTFLPYDQLYKIQEDASINSTVATIAATDRDAEEFADLEYSIDISADDGNLNIDRKTGRVYVDQPLDREKRSLYTLYVTATDNPSVKENQRTNQTKAIRVEVLDVNDNTPFFTNIDDTTIAPVLENAVPGDLVYTVSAEDNDVGVNAKLEYSLSANNTIMDLFTINTVSKSIGGVPKYFGDIKINMNASLLSMVGEIHVNITVRDSGTQSRSAATTLVIVVEDVNLHQPEFTHPPGPRATINTLEEQRVGTVIFTIKATDADHGRNAELRYSLLPENDWEKFDIDPVSGNLTNRKNLNRESMPSYEIKVQAKDNGIPNQLDNVLTLIVVLIDVDDQPPEFPRGRDYAPYVIQVEEESTAAVRSLNIAVDRDADENAVTCYYIIGGDPEKTNFTLDVKGNLTLKTKLDRESLPQPVIYLIVWATPRCYDNSITDNLRPAVQPTDYNTNLTLLWVKVEIQDINDNPPIFRQGLLTLGVTRDAGYGSALLNLQDLVTDADATKKVEFFELRTEQHLQGTQLSGKPFKVFPNGTVATNTYFQTNMYGYFLVFIQAKEKVTGGDPFIANATLRISLVNDDQRVKVVFRFPPDAVRTFQVNFNKKLEEVIGYRVVLDKIQTHENKYGQPEVNKTDMLIHGEDFKTNETISAQELLRVIDSYAEALLGLKYEYKVLEIVPTVKTVEEDNLENVYKMALILVSIALFLLCVAISVVFYISRQQYKRKLKAATAMAYGSSSDLQKLEMPGTNVHAYENVNPIYLEKVMLEEIGEQNDIDNDSLDNNAVDPSKPPSAFSEQQLSMNFYTEDNNFNKVPQAKIGNGDAILNSVLEQHEASKNKNPLQNGHMSTFKQDNFEGLPTTEI